MHGPSKAGLSLADSVRFASSGLGPARYVLEYFEPIHSHSRALGLQLIPFALQVMELVSSQYLQR